MKKIAFSIAAMILAQTAFAKGIEITNAFARPTVEGMHQSGAFMTLKNTDKHDNALVGASVSKKWAGRTELHTHINENGVMKMRQVQAIALPAGETVELKSGSLHIMFFDLKQQLTAGKVVPITLQFQNGKRKIVNVPVKAMSQTAMPEHEHHHDDAHSHTHSH